MPPTDWHAAGLMTEHAPVAVFRRQHAPATQDGVGGEEEFRGGFADELTAVKSAVLLSVSVAPAPARTSVVVVLSPGAAVFSKQLGTPVPYPTSSSQLAGSGF